MIPNMVGVEYNTWLSLINYIGQKIPEVMEEFNIPMQGSETLEIIPAYPTDLTKFRKPSIIVQKIHTAGRTIGFGNVLGMYENDDRIYDVSGKIFHTMFQCNVEGRNNIQCDLMTSMLTEGILERTRGIYNEDSANDITLFSYIHNINDPVPVGRIDIVDEIRTIPVSSNINKDYINLVQFGVVVVQSIIDPEQDMVDLSKPIRFKQTIRL